MSGEYVYCLTTPMDDPGAELAGLHGKPVVLRPLDDTTLWTSPVEAPPKPSLERVRTHDAVVESAWRSADACIPFRFGQWFPSSTAADEAVEERRGPFTEALERVRDASEMDLKVLMPDGGESPSDPDGAPADGDEGAGRAYMESLRDRQRTRRRREELGREMIEEVREAVAEIASDERVLEPSGRRFVADLAHLVPRGREGAWRSAVDDVRKAHPELRFLATGPWPPYSFGP